jgi:hypothetical protein
VTSGKTTGVSGPAATGKSPKATTGKPASTAMPVMYRTIIEAHTPPGDDPFHPEYPGFYPQKSDSWI